MVVLAGFFLGFFGVHVVFFVHVTAMLIALCFEGGFSWVRSHGDGK